MGEERKVKEEKCAFPDGSRLDRHIDTSSLRAKAAELSLRVIKTERKLRMTTQSWYVSHIGDRLLQFKRSFEHSLIVIDPVLCQLFPRDSYISSVRLSAAHYDRHAATISVRVPLLPISLLYRSSSDTDLFAPYG